MAGPNGERCADCIKWDINKRVCRARAPGAQVAPVGVEYTLVLPQMQIDDYCVNDFIAAKIEIKTKQ